MADVLRVHGEDRILGDVCGLVADPFQETRDENQIESLFDLVGIFQIPARNRAYASSCWAPEKMKSAMKTSIGDSK